MQKLTNKQRANLVIFLLLSGYENAEADQEERSISIRNNDHELVATILIDHGDRRNGALIDASMGNNDQVLISIMEAWLSEHRSDVHWIYDYINQQ